MCRGALNCRDIGSNRAFSLIEILVVVGIISVLAFFAIPALSTSKKDSRETATKGSLWSINMGLLRAHKDKDIQTAPGGVLSQNPNVWEGHPEVTENALAYLIERGYVR